MQIIGVDYIEYEPFNFVRKIQDFKNVKNAIFDFDESFLKGHKEKFSIICHDKNQVLLSNASGAKYIILKDESLAKWAVKMAEFYMFDSKISLIIKSTDELTNCADIGVDCAILKNAINENYHNSRNPEI